MIRKSSFACAVISALLAGTAFAAADTVSSYAVLQAASNINLRLSPGLDGEVCAVAPEGSRFIAELPEFQGSTHEWLQLIYALDAEDSVLLLPDGCLTAYAAGANLTKTGSAVPDAFDATPYASGFFHLDRSPAAQRAMAEKGGPKTAILKNDSLQVAATADGTAVRTISGEDFYGKHAFVITAETGSRVQLTDLYCRSEPVWADLQDIEALCDSFSCGSGRSFGEYLIMTLGGNTAEICRNFSGLDVSVERRIAEHGSAETRIRADGLEVTYNNPRNLSLMLSREGAGLGGIFIRSSNCNVTWLKKIFGAAANEVSLPGGKKMLQINGGPDGWNFALNLHLTDDGLVERLDFSCWDVDLSH